MATFNQCQFIGRLGKDPEQTVVNGSPVTKFSLAVDQGKGQKPLWLIITTWDRLAEVVKQYARKGMQVFVQGKLVLRSYQDKNQVERVTGNCSDLTFLINSDHDRRRSGPTAKREPGTA